VVDFISVKKSFSKTQLREYEVQKVVLFAESGDVEFSISLAIERALCIVEPSTNF